MFPTKIKCIRYVSCANSIAPLNNAHATLHKCYTVLTPIRPSDGAYTTWMTREATLALEHWTRKYVLTHDHLRPAVPPNAGCHAACLAVLVNKLDDQGWYAHCYSTLPLLSHNATPPQQQQQLCIDSKSARDVNGRSYSRTCQSPTEERIVSEMYLCGLNLETQFVDEVKCAWRLHALCSPRTA